MRTLKSCAVLLVAGVAIAAASSIPGDCTPDSDPPVCSTFTGPRSPYNLSSGGLVYVVQGTALINTFSLDSGYRAFAISDTIRTRPFQAGTGPFSCSSGCEGAEYTLGGLPTGTVYTTILPPGVLEEFVYDATSDGRYNYYVQTLGYEGSDPSAGLTTTQDVYRTDLDWQNPVRLFSMLSTPGEWLGIAYDPWNNSLWLSRADIPLIADYSLSGVLLSSFHPYHPYGALGMDPKDRTLWVAGESNPPFVLEQYSTSGKYLQSWMVPGLPPDIYLAGDFASTGTPEPAPAALLAAGLMVVCLLRSRK